MLMISKAGTGNISNSIFGSVIYPDIKIRIINRFAATLLLTNHLIIFFMAFLGQLNHIFYLAIISVIGSIYLAYTQITKIKSFCLVCSGIYLVNLLLLVFSYMKLF